MEYSTYIPRPPGAIAGDMQATIDQHGAQWLVPDLPTLAARELGDPEIRIAIIDGPVDTGHVCLGGARLVQGTLVATERSDGGVEAPTRDGSDHGTLVASVLFGQPGTSVRGIAPHCSGIALPVYRQGEDGSLVGCSQRDLARALAQAQAHGAHIIVISGGELVRHGDVDGFLRDAVDRCTAGNTAIVAAVGNEGRAYDHVPAALPSVLAVGAIDTNGQPFPLSNFGPGVRNHGIMAPGVHIRGATPGDQVMHVTGTSFATPVVAGVMALLLTLQRRQGRTPDARAVSAAILETAIPCDERAHSDCRRMLGGTLNLVGALERLGLAAPGESVASLPSAEPWSHPPHNVTSIAQSSDIAPSAASSLSFVKRYIMEHSNEPSSPAEHASQVPVNPGDITFAAQAAPALNAGSAVAPSGLVQPACPSVAPVHSHAMIGIRPAGSAGTAEATVRAAQKPSMSAPGFPQPDSELVYVIGQLGYDFGTEARRDYFIQNLPDGITGILDPVKMAQYLGGDAAKNLQDRNTDADALIWTINIDGNPVYAIRPDDGFSFIIYAQLIVFLKEQELQDVERISVAGELKGSTRLFSGDVVPTISPVLRGMFNWSTQHIIQALGTAGDEAMKAQLSNFLERVYYELRNLGTAPQERAINYAATNAFQAKEVFVDALKDDLQLDKIAVEKSPICRPESDCWDVKLTFFDPKKIHERARKVYRYTVDVVDMVPVTVGKMRAWYQY